MTDSASPETARAAGFKRRGRIVLSLFAVLAFCGLAPLGTVAWKLIDRNREALTTSQQQLQLRVVGALANEVDGEVEGLHSQLLRVSQTLGAALHGNGSPPRAEIEGVLHELAQDALLYTRFSYGSSRGGGSLSAGGLPTDAELVFRVAVQQAVEQLSRGPHDDVGPVVFSEPLLPSPQSARAVMVLSAPVRSSGRLRGVLSVLVDLQAIWDGVSRLSEFTSFVLDADGRIIASSDPAILRPGRDASRSSLVQRFLSGKGLRRETMPYVEDPELEAERYIGAYAETRDRWGVFVRAPERQVYAIVREMVGETLRLAAIALGLAGLAALFFARTLSTPIDRLAAASRAFAQGDLGIRVATRSGNEIGELAHSFNQMADRIESQIQRLRRAAEENNELFLGTIRALAQAIDAKDPYTRGHSVRVNRYAVAVAHTMGLDERQIRDVHVASLLHDVGKIGIDERVLNKPGKLTPEEFEMMKRHTVLGANIMAPIAQMQDIIPGLRSHHERWAGGGYPDGLQGEEIPLMARIISVADTFDAMTTTRPYQRTYDPQEALEVIRRLKGQVLDERVVAAFYRAYAAGKIRPDPDSDETEPDLSGLPATATG